MAYLGTGTSVPIRIDDTALGISLADQISSKCPDPGQCLLLIECTWGTLVKMPEMPGVKEDVVAIRRIVAKIEGAEKIPLLQMPEK
jgi:hypothetical protein